MKATHVRGSNRSARVLVLGAVWGWGPPAALREAGADDLLPEPTSIGPSLLRHLPLMDSA
ncbi:hypothetical protein RB628_15655 [Streptomyces sp. ADMS]|uniref:hypothetical protein n=1 Tax=Streptomyces sp. ADMS TaxID=3071415 RepID=UPI00296E68EC|nr:hypothetical protein [Streptomyces sp. ADMS]MDW4906737.1 hypothetical protein [Streptomyces sp. ADMS]